MAGRPLLVGRPVVACSGGGLVMDARGERQGWGSGRWFLACYGEIEGRRDLGSLDKVLFALLLAVWRVERWREWAPGRRALAARLGVPQSSVEAALGRLVAAGLVRVVRVDGSQRCQYVPAVPESGRLYKIPDRVIRAGGLRPVDWRVAGYVLDGREAESGLAPSEREIGEALGLSRRTVSWALARLVRRGVLALEWRGARRRRVLVRVERPARGRGRSAPAVAASWAARVLAEAAGLRLRGGLVDCRAVLGSERVIGANGETGDSTMEKRQADRPAGAADGRTGYSERQREAVRAAVGEGCRDYLIDEALTELGPGADLGTVIGRVRALAERERENLDRCLRWAEYPGGTAPTKPEWARAKRYASPGERAKLERRERLGRHGPPIIGPPESWPDVPAASAAGVGAADCEGEGESVAVDDFDYAALGAVPAADRERALMAAACRVVARWSDAERVGLAERALVALIKGDVSPDIPAALLAAGWERWGPEWVDAGLEALDRRLR